jgi:PAS domain S-box-containing protein
MGSSTTRAGGAFPVVPTAGVVHDDDGALEHARRRLIARRLPLFAACWLGTVVVWSAVLVHEGLLGPPLAIVALAVQAAVAYAALTVAWSDPVGRALRPVAVAAVIGLGVASVALFAGVRGDGDMLAFVLLTLYLASSLFFAWGWRTALVVLVSTVVPWLAAGPLLRFYLPTVELVAAIGIGSTVCLGIAEAAARGFGTGFLRGAREEEATRALAASRDAYRDLAENASDLIYTHDLEGRLTYVNPAFARIAGEPATALVGRHSGEFVVDDPARPDIAAIIARVVAGEPLPPQLVPIARDDAGGLRWVECAVSGICDPSGAVVGVRGIARDVTERKRAEDALRASLQELLRSEEKLRLLAQRQAMIREDERKRLGFDLHDDVCQELVGVGILLESVRRQLGPLPPQTAQALERVGKYLGEVVEHLRLLARDLRPLLLHDLGLEGSLRSLGEGMSSAATRVTTEFPMPVPRLADEVEIGIYRHAQEALANAMRHAAARSITLSLATGRATLRLEVRDDGRGFTPDERARVSCLGLVSMEERALALGGWLEINSTPGEGTVVRVECPLAARTPASAA